jgi:glutamate dehydrogenase/leucine dehydrogenase
VALSADRIEHLTGEFEEITYLADPRSGLRAILAVHDTSLGPALGGIRCCAYADEAAALADVLDLARDMTAKVMLAELPAGGGKCVVLDHPGLDRKEAYSRLGDHIDAMRGRFFTAADLGTTVRDLKQVSRRTRFVATPEHGVSEDLAGRAAEGVFLAAGTALDVLGQAEWNGCRIAIQGLCARGRASSRATSTPSTRGAPPTTCRSRWSNPTASSTPTATSSRRARTATSSTRRRSRGCARASSAAPRTASSRAPSAATCSRGAASSTPPTSW